MTSRIDIQKLSPDAYKAMFGLENYLNQSSLSQESKGLIKIRASILNDCQYCLHMHIPSALSAGLSQKKIDALNEWQSSRLFDEQERAILALTDEITHISKQGVSDSVYRLALSQLGEEHLAQCIMQITTINAWNRIAVSTALSA